MSKTKARSLQPVADIEPRLVEGDWAGAVIGATFQAGMVIWGTLLQRRVPPEMLGRVSSLDFFVSLVFMPLSFALAGPVRVSLPLPWSNR